MFARVPQLRAQSIPPGLHCCPQPHHSPVALSPQHQPAELANSAKLPSIRGSCPTNPSADPVGHAGTLNNIPCWPMHRPVCPTDGRQARTCGQSVRLGYRLAAHPSNRLAQPDPPSATHPPLPQASAALWQDWHDPSWFRQRPRRHCALRQNYRSWPGSMPP